MCNKIYNIMYIILFTIDNPARFGSMHACEVLLGVFAKFINNDEIVELCCMSISALCRDCFSNKSVFYTGGLATLIFKAIGRNGVSPNSVAAALRACAVVSQGHPDNQNTYGSAQALRVIHRAAYNTHVASQAVATNLCGFVGSFATMSGMFQASLSNNGFLNLVLTCLRAHGTSVSVAREGVWAISSLCYKNIDNKVKLGNMGACDVTVKILKAYGPVVPLIAKWACAACSNLSAGSTENTARLVAGGASESIFSTLQSHAKIVSELNNSRPQRTSSNAANAPRDAAASTENVGARSKTIAEEMDIVKYACWALSNLVQISSVSITLGQMGACESITEILRDSYKESGTLTLLLCITVSALCQVAVNQEKLKSAGIVPILSEIMNKYIGGNIASVVETILARLNNVAGSVKLSAATLASVSDTDSFKPDGFVPYTGGVGDEAVIRRSGSRGNASTDTLTSLFSSGNIPENSPMRRRSGERKPSWETKQLPERAYTSDSVSSAGDPFAAFPPGPPVASPRTPGNRNSGSFAPAGLGSAGSETDPTVSKLVVKAAQKFKIFGKKSA